MIITNKNLSTSISNKTIKANFEVRNWHATFEQFYQHEISLVPCQAFRGLITLSGNPFRLRGGASRGTRQSSRKSARVRESLIDTAWIKERPAGYIRTARDISIRVAAVVRLGVRDRQAGRQTAAIGKGRRCYCGRCKEGKEDCREGSRRRSRGTAYPG